MIAKTNDPTLTRVLSAVNELGNRTIAKRICGTVGTAVRIGHSDSYYNQFYRLMKQEHGDKEAAL